MKRKIFIILAILSFNMLCIENYAQTIDHYELKYGLLDFTPDTSFGEMDSTLVSSMIDKILQFVPDVFIFDKNKVASVFYDDSGKSAEFRFVFEKGTMFIFNEQLKEYIKNDSLENTNKINSFNGAIEIISDEDLPDKLFGFKVKKLKIKIKGTQNEMETIYTPELKSLEIKGMQNFNFGIEEISLRTKIKFPGFGTVNIGVKDFSRKIIHPEYLSTSLDNYSNAEEILNEINISNEETESDKLDSLTENFYGLGENIDIVNKLINGGYINKNCYFSLFTFKNIQTYNASIDKISIIKILKERGTEKINQSKNSILAVISGFKLLSQNNIKKAQKINNEFKDFDNNTFWDAILLLAIKEHLSLPETKKIIINNHIKFGLVDSINTTAKENYIEGKLDFSEYISKECPLLTNVKYGYAANKSETKKAVQDFFNVAFDGITIPIEIEERNDTFVIKTPDFEYLIKYNDLREIDYDFVNEETDKVTYKDTVQLDLSFYNTLLQTVKQIDADYDFPYAFSMFDFNSAFYLSLDEYDYQYLVKKIPDLRYNKIEFALNRFLSKDYDVLCKVPVSYEYNKKELDEQIYLKSYKVGDVDANAEYVTTKTKRDFIKYLKDNKKQLEIDDSIINVINNKIMNTLINGNFSLLKYIPEFTFSYTIFKDDYLLYEDYTPNIDSSENTLKDVFPELNRLVKNEINPNNFKFNKGKKELSFEYKNNTYTISASYINMLHKLGNILYSENSKKRIYSLYIGYQETLFFYLTKNQLSDIENLIGYNLSLVK